MRDKLVPSSIDSPRGSVSRKTSVNREPDSRHGSTATDVRLAKEKDLLKEIKQTLRNDAWKQLSDLIVEWEVVSTRDVLVECGIQFLNKERSLSERVFEHVIKRGPLKYREYSFASAMLHLAECEFQLHKTEDCLNILIRALRFVDQNLRACERDPQKSLFEKAGVLAPTVEEWVELKDWGSVFLAVASFRVGRFEDTLKMLDGITDYQVVLKPGRFAFLSLVKAKSFLELRQPEEAVRVLKMRQSQEDALSQIEHISVSKDERDIKVLRQASLSTRAAHLRSEGNGHPSPSLSASRNFDDATDSLASVHACHDLHILLLANIADGRFEEDARELFKDVKGDGSKRPSSFKEFLKKASEEEVGNKLIEAWTPRSEELGRRM
ncbi:hypothetical protein BC830DRAFT_1107425 [Chytriomyces sp. MP71]|nr:hypothetical protein BC830DRAFT_1107425 [Chytriomyces sp. MP71]